MPLLGNHTTVLSAPWTTNLEWFWEESCRGQAQLAPPARVHPLTHFV